MRRCPPYGTVQGKGQRREAANQTVGPLMHIPRLETGGQPMKPQPLPEFSRPALMEQLKPGLSEMRVEADAEERAALARRFGIVSIE